MTGIDLNLYENPTALLQKLIQFNTINPPGNETECVQFIAELLRAAGIETQLIGKNPDRLNLFARLEGKKESAPVLFYGHADVVTTEGQKWKYPPFEGVVAEDCIWGRGALDMKGALTMMICTLLRAKKDGFQPKGDILFNVVTDEENTGEFGARYMVEEHKDLFQDVKYAIGEVGGFTLYMRNRKFYPIMVAEKQGCWLETVIKGPGGHGSQPLKDGAMARLGEILQRLNASNLPFHITPPVKMMIENLAAHMPFPANRVLKGLLSPLLSDLMLKILGTQGRAFTALLHNTVNATVVQGGSKINVVPSEVTLQLDGRLLPGAKPEELIKELHELLGYDLDFEVLVHNPGPATVDLGMLPLLTEVMKGIDPEGIPFPYVLTAVTDARFYSRLGIQTYGFTPIVLPPTMDFSRLVHGVDERIPVQALEAGVEGMYELIRRL